MPRWLGTGSSAGVISEEKSAEVQNYAFPSSLYETEDKNGVELAVGGQYTTDTFNVFGPNIITRAKATPARNGAKQRELMTF